MESIIPSNHGSKKVMLRDIISYSCIFYTSRIPIFLTHVFQTRQVLHIPSFTTSRAPQVPWVHGHGQIENGELIIALCILHDSVIFPAVCEHSQARSPKSTSEEAVRNKRNIQCELSTERHSTYISF